jgi:2-polyprenyl-6-methoxyphenol hydroxylase-like FAD-dependent oxidoreductase
LFYNLLRDAFPVQNFHAGRNVTSIVPSRDGAAAILDDGTRFEGDLLIGADGMRSVVRRALFPMVEPRYVNRGSQCRPTSVRMMCPRQLIEGVRANGAEIGEGGNLLMAVLAVRRRVFHNVSQWARPKEVIEPLRCRWLTNARS